MFTLNCSGRLLVIDNAVVMGIVNTTPDSFYSGSRMTNDVDVIAKAAEMIEEGAAIIDIGGQSTRPGSQLISVEEELKRVVPAIKAIHREFPQQILSVDTFYSAVAKAAVEAGAHIVNDVSAGTMDKQMVDTVAALRVPYVLMHMPGTPQNMQNATYTELLTDIFDYLSHRIRDLTEQGIKDLLVDVGFGFGKTAKQNMELLQQLAFFQNLERPLMVGLSRKATIYKTLNIAPEEALNGTTVLHTIALLNGANILRAHDVKEAMQAIKLCAAYKQQPSPL